MRPPSLRNAAGVILGLLRELLNAAAQLAYLPLKALGLFEDLDD